MSTTVHFLSGLPRSGSTLLGSLLSQNTRIHVTPTSPLLDLLCLTNENLNSLSNNYTYDRSVDNKLYKSIVNTYYGQFGKPIVIDKHRGWPRNVVPAIECITEHPKIICTYRPISEVITSYLVLIEKQQGNNFVDRDLLSIKQARNTENRAKRLWESYVSDPYNSLVHGLTNHKNNIHLVSYDDLTSRPIETLQKIYDFLHEDYYHHNIHDITNACAEDKDVAWGLAGLHDIRPKLNKISRPPASVLGPYLKSYYDQFNITP